MSALQVGASLNVNPTSKRTTYLVAITTPSASSDSDYSSGAIDVHFPPGFTLDPFCKQAHDSQLSPNSAFNCVSAGQVLTLSGYDSIPKGTSIKILVSAKNPPSTLSSPSFSFFIYGDLAKT